MTTARENNLPKKATTRSLAEKVHSKRQKKVPSYTLVKVILTVVVKKKKRTKITEKNTITKKKLGKV